MMIPLSPAAATAKTFLLALLLALPAVAAAETITVTLLGTGTPRPIIERFGPSILVEAGEEKLLFDCGRGVSQRLWQLGLPLRSITVVFLTHLHSDHVIGLPDLWLTGMLATVYGGRRGPLHVRGPAGTRELATGLKTAYRADLQFRLADEAIPERNMAIESHEIEQGQVYERNGVRVTAFDVDHSPVIKPALGFRIDYGNRSVVLSGDTRFSENLIRYAEGADLLLHEVAAARPEFLASSAAARRIIGHHTEPEQAGIVFRRVRPRLAIYTHIALIGNDDAGIPGPDELTSRTRETYNGPLEIGEDLMRIDVGDTIEVRRYTGGRP